MTLNGFACCFIQLRAWRGRLRNTLLHIMPVVNKFDDGSTTLANRYGALQVQSLNDPS